MLSVHIGIASMRQFQCVPATYVTEIKKPILKYALNRHHVHWLSSNCQSVLKLQIVTKFDFMTYAFAKLVVARLYWELICVLYFIFSFLFDSLQPSKIFFSHVRMGLSVLNQY